MAMTPGQIKKELRKRKISMSAVGRRLRPPVKPVSVHRVVYRIRGGTSARIQRAIAKAIGKEVEEVFGEAA
jgi:hypothetical protein